MVLVVEPLLGTRAEVSVVVDGRQDRAIEERVVAEAARLESILTAFDDESDLSRFRRTGRVETPELGEVLELSSLWNDRTSGAFSPWTATLTHMWDRAEANGSVPTDAALADAVSGHANRAQSTDVHALAKGWVAERALTSVLTPATAGSEDADAWLSLGGDVVQRGSRPITVGIEDPARPYDNVAPMATVEISNESLATSGGARRFWTIDGTRYSKTLDPRTGRPVDHIASATVVAPEAAAADVLATVALILDPAETLELVERWGAACFIVDREGRMVSSSERFALA